MPLSANSAAVVGSGPNGLGAALALARAGWKVRVHEQMPEAGGGLVSSELTLPGFVHDHCAAVLPFAIASPFFRTLPLERHGLRWILPPIQLAHPLDNEPPVLVHRSLEDTVESIGTGGATYGALIEPTVRRWDVIRESVLGPLFPPRHPIAMALFGIHAIRSAASLAARSLAGVRARAMFAGIAAHGCVPLSFAGSASFGLVLAAAAHADGWPIVEGGSMRLADAAAAELHALGGEIRTNAMVRSLEELDVRIKMLDVAPGQFARLAGDTLPSRFSAAMSRYRHGPGIFKCDWALSEPVPWRHAECALAGVVHLGGTIDEIAHAESEIWRGRTAARPFVLLAQPSLFDPTRAPAGKHTLWAYCHVPAGSEEDMTSRIEDQIERFAPGFRDTILARVARGPREIERRNPNMVGGDIGGGANTLWQLLFRPRVSVRPYHTPLSGVYLCSASTPPGGGVHGMCGVNAARAALREFG